MYVLQQAMNHRPWTRIHKGYTLFLYLLRWVEGDGGKGPTGIGLGP